MGPPEMASVWRVFAPQAVVVWSAVEPSSEGDVALNVYSPKAQWVGELAATVADQNEMLVTTVPPDQSEAILRLIRTRDHPAWVIGEITKGTGITVLA